MGRDGGFGSFHRVRGGSALDRYLVVEAISAAGFSAKFFGESEKIRFVQQFAQPDGLRLREGCGINGSPYRAAGKSARPLKHNAHLYIIALPGGPETGIRNVGRAGTGGIGSQKILTGFHAAFISPSVLNPAAGCCRAGGIVLAVAPPGARLTMMFAR
jgi:hypothetical protein